ncbi:MAG: glycosyltransferase [Akkermansiaceae bacterium]|nr:glycosyltransferase [Verrucomicrobiales bacterium]
MADISSDTARPWQDRGVPDHLNVALVNNHYRLGGAETVLRQLHEAYLRSGYESRILLANGKTYPADSTVEPMYPRLLSHLSHSRFHRLTEALAPRSDWTERKFLQLAGSTADVVHLHSFHGLYASIEALAELARRKPVVWTFHRFWGITGGCDHPGHCTRYLSACGNCPKTDEWPLCGKDDTAEQLARKLKHLRPAPLTIVAPSRHLAERVRHSLVGRQWRVEHIPNGVNPDAYSYSHKSEAAFRQKLGLDPKAIVVLIVNRNFADPVKGFPVIAEALQQLDHPRVQLVLAGGESAHAAGKIPSRLRHVDAGYISDEQRMAALYEAADIFLYASPGENFPCVIIEAMASKCCVVATPTDGVLEQIEHGESGLLAEAMTGNALATVLRRAINDSSERLRLANNARRRIETEFSESLMVDRHLRLYADVIANAS